MSFDPVRTIRHTVDGSGNKVALVPLGRQGSLGMAVIEEADFELLESLGLSFRWTKLAKSGQVMASCSRASGNSVQVARVLLDLGPGEDVKYLSDDRTDLRRGNLGLNPEGHATRRDRDYLMTKERRSRIQHVYD
jgi:hypothetical protein